MKKFLTKLYHFSGTWTGTIVIVLFIIFFIAQSFVIPSGSMKRTLLIGDFLFAKKYSYGTPIPHLPWVEVPILPDIFDNGHLIEGDKPQREDIVIFRFPDNNKIHYVKRCVAVGGDEIIYLDKKMIIHFHEGDAYIKANYPKEKIITLRDKLWVVNPYMSKYTGIQYVPESEGNIFESLLNYYIYDKGVDMSPIYIQGFEAPIYNVNNRPINALYKKVEEGHYYMIGDNRDNSNDSRFWGSIPYKLIVGKPWLIYFSLETRSYEKMLKGDDAFGSGRDNAGLKRVCQGIAIDSQECQELWNSERYSVRWGRIGRQIESLQLEQPIQ